MTTGVDSGQKTLHTTFSNECKFSWDSKARRKTSLTIVVLKRGTGGHFACACVNPLNDNSVGASNLMAGNRKLKRKLQSF